MAREIRNQYKYAAGQIREDNESMEHEKCKIVR